MVRWLSLITALLLLPMLARAHPEKEHANALCSGFDKIEFRNSDGTRTDCLNAQHAVEVDYTQKWAEGLGQALFYAHLHGREPGIILVCHPDRQLKTCDTHVERAMATLSAYALAAQVWSFRHDHTSLAECKAIRVDGNVTAQSAPDASMSDQAERSRN